MGRSRNSEDSDKPEVRHWEYDQNVVDKIVKDYSRLLESIGRL